MSLRFLPAFFLVFLLSLSFNHSYSQIREREWVEISKFVDGDTFWVMDSKGQKEKIRLIGIDAPEARKTGKKDIEQFGKEASTYVQRLLYDKKVRLEFDVGRYDRFKRTLAYVYLEDGTFLNAHLVKEGYATVMTVPPNVRHADLFVKLQQDARSNKKGLWAYP
jgi:micrococcal nuclease